MLSAVFSLSLSSLIGITLLILLCGQLISTIPLQERDIYSRTGKIPYCIHRHYNLGELWITVIDLRSAREAVTYEDIYPNCSNRVNNCIICYYYIVYSSITIILIFSNSIIVSVIIEGAQHYCVCHKLICVIPFHFKE